MPKCQTNLHHSSFEAIRRNQIIQIKLEVNLRIAEAMKAYQNHKLKAHSTMGEVRQ